MRQSKKHEIIRNYHITKSHEISKKAAELWALESKETRDYYAQQSLEEHNKFKELNPDFDWQPWKKRKKNEDMTSSPSTSIKDIQAYPSPVENHYPTPDENIMYTFPDLTNQFLDFSYTPEFSFDMQAIPTEVFNFDEFIDFGIC
ncbi:hypothetical protein HDV01_006062 [Terramyces sp. JEL0728]|nr:hypothetical protein HDV01_006062 [Terramyces sp. JEL0728]